MAVSPHLDDAVFSVGGTLARLAERAEVTAVTVVTCFTGSTDPARVTPFGLSTQLDKGLAADVDYMALRRDEDRAALDVLGAAPHHLDLLEAPHRGYDSAPELFAGRHDDDAVAGPLTAALAPLVADADVVLAPQALGDHVDHQWVSAVVAGLVDAQRCAWWRDTPYVVRRPDATPMEHVAGDEVAVDVGAQLERKVAAVTCYRTQVPFQFGSAAQAGPTLTALARAEGERTGAGGAVEVLRAGAAAADVLRR